MKALLATLLIALSLTFAGCSGGDDATTETPAAEEAPAADAAE